MLHRMNRAARRARKAAARHHAVPAERILVLPKPEKDPTRAGVKGGGSTNGSRYAP